MDDPFGNALMIEVKDLLSKNKILEERWSARTDTKAVLVVRDRRAVIGRDHGLGTGLRGGALMSLTAGGY